MGTAKRQKARERAARLREEERHRDRQRSWLVRGATAALIVVVGAGLVVAFMVGGGNGREGGRIPGVKTFGTLSRNHVQGKVDYKQTPPVGGDHNPVWLNCGIYSSPVRNENAVHSLEHGTVWITYRPNLPKDQVDHLRDLVRGKDFVILSPYPDLPSPVVASAWSTQLRLPNASDSRLEDFLKTYVRGPQTPEPNAACTGGTGKPES